MDEFSPIRALLRSSQSHIEEGCALVDQGQHTIFLTMTAIYDSECLIARSDLLIARLLTLHHHDNPA